MGQDIWQCCQRNRLLRLALATGCAGFFPSGSVYAQTDLPEMLPDSLPETLSGTGIVAIAIGLGAMALIVAAILTTSRLRSSSLFNRLFIIVAVSSGFFSAISSAIGFGLITSQESDDLFRNTLLPPAFGMFVFFLAVAIWVGGAEFVRNKDWFRGIANGFIADMLFFVERCLKLFVVIPILAIILFFVSTWTTVVGIGGADAVRHTYQFELDRLQTECVGITSYRQADLLVLQDLRLSVDDVARVAASERDVGSQSGSRGQGAVTDYFFGIERWYKGLEQSIAALVEGPDPAGASPYDADICQAKSDELRLLLAQNAFENYDAWASNFETAFDEFASLLNRWRHDRRVERLLEQQLGSFSRANPMPRSTNSMRVFPSQTEAMERYAQYVDDALSSLIRKRKLAKPPVPQRSAAMLSPERGLDIFRTWINPPEPAPEPAKKPSRTAAVVAAEFIPGLSIISPRDAVLKNANIFSDIWALAISWDYAAYILMFAFLFFPSAERAAPYKDE